MKTIQQQLFMSTMSESLRSDATGWGWEDPSCLQSGPIGRSPSWRNGFRPPSYATVYHALADGWKLLAPPARDESPVDGGGKFVEWSWWLVREVEA